MWSRVKKYFKKSNMPAKALPQRLQPRILSRSEHVISRAYINEYALKVLYRLREHGYQAYLVGGGVRDLLLGREPKDFDVATDATPEQVRRVFRNCRLIGRRFRLAHIHFGAEIIEVATFRGAGVEHGEEGGPGGGMLLRDNCYGTIEEDALRRDFTVNALYYNIDNFSVIDYADGVRDLEAGRLRLLGDPESRFREDPVRMLRAVRFAAKLGFFIDPECEQQIYQHSALLHEVPPARLFDEILKLFMGGMAVETFAKMRHYHLFGHLFPDTEKCLSREEQGFPITFVVRALENTDRRIEQGLSVTPFFLYAALLWEPTRRRYEALLAAGEPSEVAMEEAASEVLARQIQRISIPRRFSQPLREIWALQPRFYQRRGKQPERLIGHPRFRAAYDFMLLRATAGEIESELADWWRQMLEGGEPPPVSQSAAEERPTRKKRRRPRRRKPARAS